MIDREIEIYSKILSQSVESYKTQCKIHILSSHHVNILVETATL